MKHPEYDRTRYTVWALPNAMIWHWLLNPGLAVNELLLGMRIPEVMLVDRTSDQPLPLRTYVPCPHCGTIHPSMLWGKGNAFGHWYGYLCPSCDKIIPCLRNWTSLLTLLITYPLWFLPARLLKPGWLAYEKVRLKRKLGEPSFLPTVALTYRRAFVAGLCWGVLMWLAMDVVPSLYTYRTMTSPVIDVGRLIYGLPICLFLGLVWGLLMGLFMQSFNKYKGKKGENPSAKAP